MRSALRTARRVAFSTRDDGQRHGIGAHLDGARGGMAQRVRQRLHEHGTGEIGLVRGHEPQIAGQPHPRARGAREPIRGDLEPCGQALGRRSAPGQPRRRLGARTQRLDRLPGFHQAGPGQLGRRIETIPQLGRGRLRPSLQRGRGQRDDEPGEGVRQDVVQASADLALQIGRSRPRALALDDLPLGGGKVVEVPLAAPQHHEREDEPGDHEVEPGRLQALTVLPRRGHHGERRPGRHRDRGPGRQ